MANRREVFSRRVPLYRKAPCRFFAEVTGFAPDPWQKEAATAIAQHRKVTIRSGQGVGKTAFEANLVLWFLSCFSYPRVVCTAPTRQQLNDVLWAEIAKWQERSPLLQGMLVWTKTRVYMKGHEKRWFAVARTATKPENMQGFHEDNMLFVVDEASGVADPIMEAIQGTLSGDNNRLLMCGNPTQNTGTFHDSHNGSAYAGIPNTPGSTPYTSNWAAELFGPANLQKATSAFPQRIYNVVLQGALGISQDGIFGANTEASVKKFQQSHGLTADGIVGAKTKAALAKLF